MEDQIIDKTAIICLMGVNDILRFTFKPSRVYIGIVFLRKF